MFSTPLLIAFLATGLAVLLCVNQEVRSWVLLACLLAGITVYVAAFFTGVVMFIDFCFGGVDASAYWQYFTGSGWVWLAAGWVLWMLDALQTYHQPSQRSPY